MGRQFGHNDQKAAANISLSEYQSNLENLATEVKEAGGTPVCRPYHSFIQQITLVKRLLHT